MLPSRLRGLSQDGPIRTESRTQTLAANAARALTNDDFLKGPDGLAEDAVDLDLEAPEDVPVLDAARPKTPADPEALVFSHRVVDLLADKLASDIVLLDIHDVSLIADFFVICSAGSERQTSAILKDLSEKLQEEFSRKPLHTEGRGDSGWVLLDYGDVIVHVFSPTRRAFYKLEELWSAAPAVLRLQ